MSISVLEMNHLLFIKSIYFVAELKFKCLFKNTFTHTHLNKIFLNSVSGSL